MNRYTWLSLSEKCPIQVQTWSGSFWLKGFGGVWFLYTSTRHGRAPARWTASRAVFAEVCAAGVIRSLIRYCVVSEKMPMYTMARLSSVKLSTEPTWSVSRPVTHGSMFKQLPDPIREFSREKRQNRTQERAPGES